VPVWKSPRVSVKHGRSCWVRVVLPCSSEASGAGGRPGRLGNTASVGVSPIQCRWKTLLLPGSSSESAYERAVGRIPQIVLELVEQRFGLLGGPPLRLSIADSLGQIGATCAQEP